MKTLAIGCRHQRPAFGHPVENRLEDRRIFITGVFDADDKLGGVIDTAITREAAGMQLETNEYVMFGGVLCHRARLALITRHYN